MRQQNPESAGREYCIDLCNCRLHLIPTFHMKTPCSMGMIGTCDKSTHLLSHMAAFRMAVCGGWIKTTNQLRPVGIILPSDI